MRKLLFGLFLLCVYFNGAQGRLIAPGWNYPDNGNEAITGWMNVPGTNVPVFFYAMGYGCQDIEFGAPGDLCATPLVILEIACTNQNGWSAQDMDISSVGPGMFQWIRRTHVRVNDQLISDIGPWYLMDVTCPEQPYFLLAADIGYSAPIMFLPRY